MCTVLNLENLTALVDRINGDCLYRSNSSLPSLQGFFEGIRATRGGGGPGAPRPAVGAGALAMETMDDDDAAGGVSEQFKFAIDCVTIV